MLKNRWIYIAIAIPLLLVLAWFGASWYASTKAQEKIEAFVNKNEVLKQSLYWEKVSATPLGTVTLHNVSVSPGGSSKLQAKKIIVSDIENTENVKHSIRIEIQQFADEQGYAPAALFENLTAMSGRKHIAPVDLSLSLTMNYATDKGEFKIGFLSDEMANLNINLFLSNVEPFKEVVQIVLSEQKMGMMQALAMAEKITRQLDTLHFNSVDVNVVNNGGLTRMLTLKQRYNQLAIPKAGETKEAKLQADEELLDACKEGIYLNNPIKECKVFEEFLIGGRSKLNIKVDSKAPLSFRQLSRIEDFKEASGILWQIN